MAATPSTMRELGSPMPPFALPDTRNGRFFDSKALAGKPAVVAFVCNHCPYVVHIADALSDFGKWCEARGVGMVGISSNDVVAYPQDSPDKMAEEARRRGYVFPYLYDESQEIARAYDAACTPDFYLYDTDGKLAYRGQFDDSRPKNALPVTGAHLRAAIEAVLRGEATSSDQRPSIGCNIKWKPER